MTPNKSPSDDGDRFKGSGAECNAGQTDTENTQHNDASGDLRGNLPKVRPDVAVDVGQRLDPKHDAVYDAIWRASMLPSKRSSTCEIVTTSRSGQSGLDCESLNPSVDLIEKVAKVRAGKVAQAGRLGEPFVHRLGI